MSKLGDFLAKARESKGLSAAELARLTGISAAQISRLEDGDRSDPRFSTIIKIADALGLSIDEWAIKTSSRRRKMSAVTTSVDTETYAGRSRRSARWVDLPKDLDERFPNAESIPERHAELAVAASPYLGIRTLELVLTAPDALDETIQAAKRSHEIPESINASDAATALLRNRLDLLRQMEAIDAELSNLQEKIANYGVFSTPPDDVAGRLAKLEAQVSKIQKVALRSGASEKALRSLLNLLESAEELPQTLRDRLRGSRGVA